MYHLRSFSVSTCDNVVRKAVISVKSTIFVPSNIKTTSNTCYYE